MGIFKIGDRVYDPDCDMKGTRWNGEPLSNGYGWGTVESVMGLFVLVKFDNYHRPIMHGDTGMRFDRSGKQGSKRLMHEHEAKGKGLF